MTSTQKKKTDRYSLAQAKYGTIIDNDTLDLATVSLTPAPGPNGVPPTTNSFTLRSSEYSLERLSNGKIYCKMYLLIGLTIAPSWLTSDFEKPITYNFTVTLPISLSKVKYCSWTHFDTSVNDSFIISVLAPTKTSIRVYTIQKVPTTSLHLKEGEANDIIIKIEGII